MGRIGFRLDRRRFDHIAAKSLTQKEGGSELGLVCLLLDLLNSFIPPLPSSSSQWRKRRSSALISSKSSITVINPSAVPSTRQTVLKLLDQLQSQSSSLSVPLQQKETPPPPPPPSRNGYCYVYVQSEERLSRLNVSKLSEGPNFELVCNSLSPVVCFNVESEIYMVGDFYIRHEQQVLKSSYKPFFDVLSIDDTGGKSPSFLPCTATIATPGFAAPKVHPLVVTLHGKIYVLALCPYHPSFELWADNNGKWEILPPPPIFTSTEIENRARLMYRNFIQTIYAWGHTIVVCVEWGSFCFDTKTGEWIDMMHIYKNIEDQPVLQCVAEFNNFLIAKLFFTEELVVYELDADGYPQFYQNLDELQEMFVDSHILSSTNAFIFPFEDDADKFCFICSGPTPNTDLDRSVDYFLLVAVFRMTISNLDGKQKLTAVLEAHQIYPCNGLNRFYPHIWSAFLKRDNLNLDNLKADRCFGRACVD